MGWGGRAAEGRDTYFLEGVDLVVGEPPGLVDDGEGAVSWEVRKGASYRAWIGVGSL